MKAVFLSAFVFYVSAALILVFIGSQRASDQNQKRLGRRYSFFDLLRTRKLFILSILFAAIMFTLMLFRPFVPQFLGDVYGYGDFEIGVFGSVSFFGSGVLGIVLGRLGDRWRKTLAVAVSMILCCSFLVFFVMFGDFCVLLVAFFLAGGSYLTWSLMGAIVSPLAPEQIRARWISIPQTVTMFSSFIAPYVGGVLYDISPYYPFFVGIAVTPLLALSVSSKLFNE